MLIVQNKINAAGGKATVRLLTVYFIIFMPYIALKRIIIVIQLMFLGHKYVFGPSQTHFNPRPARAKISLSRAKNIFMPANINSIVIIFLCLLGQRQRQRQFIAP